jgi:hypothetical protein
MERTLCRSSKHRLVRQRGGTGTTSVVPSATLFDVANRGPAMDKIVKYLDPRFAEDLEDADPTALLALLDTHPTFRALVPASDRDFLRYYQYLFHTVRIFATAPLDTEFMKTAYALAKYSPDTTYEWLGFTPLDDDGNCEVIAGVYTRADALRLMKALPQLGDRAVNRLRCVEWNLRTAAGSGARRAALRAAAKRMRRFEGMYNTGLPKEVMYVDTDGYITDEKPPPHTAAEEYETIVQAPLSGSDDDGDEDYLP